MSWLLRCEGCLALEHRPRTACEADGITNQGLLCQHRYETNPVYRTAWAETIGNWYPHLLAWRASKGCFLVFGLMRCAGRPLWWGCYPHPGRVEPARSLACRSTRGNGNCWCSSREIAAQSGTPMKLKGENAAMANSCGPEGACRFCLRPQVTPRVTRPTSRSTNPRFQHELEEPLAPDEAQQERPDGHHDANQQIVKEGQRRELKEGAERRHGHDHSK